MIECRLVHLEIRCLERGYTFADARACIVSQDGDRIVVDELHPAYPKKRPHPQRDQGPGTELKALLRRYLRIVTKPGCKCNARARMMDERGCQWCMDNLETIVGWLKEEHARQKILLPFVPLAARQLVKLAVRNAKKKGTCR